MQLESRHNIAKYIMAFGGVQGMNIAIGIVRTKLVAVLLGPNGMGIISLYNSAIQMMQNLTNLGLDKSGVPMVSAEFAKDGQAETSEAASCSVASASPHNSALSMFRSLVLMTAVLALVCGVALSWILSVIAFGDMSRTLHFIVLSPVASLLIMAGGEVLVLKAARRLKTVAVLSLWNVVLALIISVPLFCLWGARAIIPSLVLTALIQMLVTMTYSYRRYPLHLNISRETMRRGMPMIRLGMAFVVASGMTTGAEFLVRSFLNNEGGDTAVGLYNTAYMIAITYGGMIFASIDSEYYPRLCQIDRDDHHLLNATIRRQIRMSLMFIIPMVVVMELLLPWIVPMLFSDRFTDAIPMTQIALLSLIFRAIYLPVGYVPLSRGDSRTFLLMESTGAVMLALSVIIGYHCYGLVGAGIGLVVSNMFDMVNYIIQVSRALKRSHEA